MTKLNKLTCKKINYNKMIQKLNACNKKLQNQNLFKYKILIIMMNNSNKNNNNFFKNIMINQKYYKKIKLNLKIHNKNNNNFDKN